MDYRIIFLVFMVAVFLLYRIRSKSSFFSFISKDNILSLLMVFSIAGAIGSFVTMMSDRDPLPWVRWIGYEVGLRQLVNYAEAVPPDLSNQLDVVNVMREDTDNDGFNEWLVFYEFESGSGLTPIRAVVYDNDRGSPPTIFPYSLRSPNNAYLSSGDYKFKQEDVVTVENDDIDELLFWGYPSAPFGIPLMAQATDLTIFRYQKQGGSTWDPPTDNPSRYVPVGQFHGDAVGPLDPVSKEVTVVRQGNYERSLLATRYVYGLNNEKTSYMKADNPDELNQWIVNTIDFYPDTPSDIKSASVPEQIVLAFYAALCGSEGKDLCIHSGKNGWDAKLFLAEGSEALENYQKNASYFGIPNFTLNNISVRNLDVVGNAIEGGIIGQQNQISTVKATFIANDSPEQTVTYELQSLNGKWQIVRQLAQQVSTLGAE